MNEKILIVSNNPLSLTRNNGKTIASFLEGVPCQQVRQLYFHSEKPSVQGYSYYQLSDRQVLSGWFRSSRRGAPCTAEGCAGDNQTANAGAQSTVQLNAATRLVRELVWLGHWKSTRLLNWLEEFCPDIVFFVAGDAGFAYNIVHYIVKRFHSKLFTYITDDYIMPRRHETLLEKCRRLLIRKKMVNCMKASDQYFTISEKMQQAYRDLSGKESQILMNMTPSLKLADGSYPQRQEKDAIVMVYAGSLYYQRDRILGKVADAAAQYHARTGKAVNIQVYSNQEPDDAMKRNFLRENVCAYCGSLSYEALKVKLNQADVLLFVEAFDEGMREKTKYSLSTKVTEYLSVGKPIFAVGPKDIGSMDYLEGVAFCAYDKNEIAPVLDAMLTDEEEQARRGQKALEKFENCCTKEKQPKLFS